MINLPPIDEMKTALEIKRMQNRQPAKCNSAGYERLSGKLGLRAVYRARLEQASIASRRTRGQALPTATQETP